LPAKYMTSEEFEVIFGQIRSAVEARIPLHLASFCHHDRHRVQYSYDHSRVHEGARLPLTPQERMPLPPCSPDIHKIVEHAISNVKRKFQMLMREKDATPEIHEAVEVLKSVCYIEPTAEQLGKDCEGLVGTLEGILKEKGGWPPKRLR